MSENYNNNGEQPLKIDFSKIIVPDSNITAGIIKEDFQDTFVGNGVTYNYGISNNLTNGKVSFGSISTAYKQDEKQWNAGVDNAWGTNAKYVSEPNSNITYLNPNPQYNAVPAEQEYKGSGNVFANTPTSASKSSSTELQRMVQKLEKLEKMINPNSKKSLILWEEDNGFKNLISMIVNYANTCDVDDEFPIELFDRLKALKEDVDAQIVSGKQKIEELQAQAKENTVLGESLSNAYIAATAGLSREEYEAGLENSEIEGFKEQLATIASASPDSEEYAKAEKEIKSKINNLENSVHITIDLERTTSKGGALEYIKKEITPCVDRLEAAYVARNTAENATTIDGEDAITALAIKKSFAEKVYDTFVKPIANLFRRKTKVK